MSEVRSELTRFAQAQETVLKENDHKGGWRWVLDGEEQRCDPVWLLEQAERHIAELKKEITPPRCGCRSAGCEHSLGQAFWRPGAKEVLKRTVNIANFAMMVADVCDALPAPGKSETTKINDLDPFNKGAMQDA